MSSSRKRGSYWGERLCVPPDELELVRLALERRDVAERALRGTYAPHLPSRDLERVWLVEAASGLEASS